MLRRSTLGFARECLGGPVWRPTTRWLRSCTTCSLRSTAAGAVYASSLDTGAARYPKVYALAERTAAYAPIAAYLKTSKTFYAKLASASPGV